MIITQLIGGLGNQLFQYALARHLAQIHRTTLKIDLSLFDEYKLHKYSLGNFSITENYATKEDLALVNKNKEKHFHFDNGFKEIGDNVLLNGYWQSEKYFSEIGDIIRNEFQVKNPLAYEDLRIAKIIKESHSVSMHVRRSDYIPNTYTDQIFDSLTIEYYHEAVALLRNEERDLQFFIFSDDPEWVKSNIRLDHPVVYVDHNAADKNYEDLRLMSLCKHNIIANSSFSWWGAWLNGNSMKKVYAPKNWFNSNVRNLSPKDIIPESWIKI